MSKEMVYDFSPNGAVQGMYFDELPLNFLGSIEVKRASEILFNHDTQSWDIVLTGQDAPILPATGFSGYDVARGIEVKWLQGARKAGIDPLSKEGVLILLRTRGKEC